MKTQKLSKDLPPHIRKQLLKVQHIRDDFLRYCKNNLKIKLENGEIVPLEFNPIQKIIIKHVLDDLANDRPVRYIILKARKEGVSTLVEALIYWWTATHKNVHSKIVAHDRDTAMELYEMFRRYYDNSNPIFKPQTKYNTRTDLTFDNEQGTGLKSMIDVSSAKDTGTGRGMTITCLHGCLHKDSLVVLYDGSSKPIKDICIGDLVYTSSGDIARVSFKSMTGIKQTYKVNTWMSNEPIISSRDHKILTDVGYKKVEELNSHDWIAKPKYKFDNKLTWYCEIPQNKRPQGGGTKRITEKLFDLNEDFGYLIGYYLAEGHISKNIHRVVFTYEKSEKFVDKVKHWFPREPRTVFINGRGISEFNDAFMAGVLNKLCGRVANKHVPLFGNEEFYKGLINGYLDGDGSKTDKQRIRATSIHEKIARNINRIGDILGYHGSLQYSKDRTRYDIKTRPVWTNSFCNGKSSKYKFINGQCFVRVKSIEEFNVAETYDLEIDHPDHNFETTSGIVSNSEVASWSDGSELMAGLMQAIPKIPNTMIFLESTANGIGDFFHKTWQAAKAGNSVFKPLFFSWSDRPDYARPVPRNFKLTEEEKEIKIKNNLTDEQMQWRRETMREFADNPKKFYQEYPMTDIEAFLSSGSSRFDISALVKMEEACYPAKCYDIIEQTGKSVLENTLSYKAIEVDNAPLKIWKFPEPNKKYVIGGDVAEGIGQDFSVATIMEVENMETVARWRGDIEPADFGEILDTLGRYFNMALIACESNNHGLTTIQRLRDMAYPNLYRREKNIDTRLEKFTEKLGWQTTTKTKPLMINALSEAINLGKIIDHDLTFIRECMEYTVDERGRTNAQVGSHDDTVIATAIALQVFEWTDAVIKSRSVPSVLPQKYMEIRRNHRNLMKR
jgi:hypothetical protein